MEDIKYLEDKSNEYCDDLINNLKNQLQLELMKGA